MKIAPSRHKMIVSLVLFLKVTLAKGFGYVPNDEVKKSVQRCLTPLKLFNFECVGENHNPYKVEIFQVLKAWSRSKC